MDSAIVPASLLVLSLLSCAHLQYCETHAGPSIQLPPDGISDQSNGYRRISDNDDDDDEADKRSLREQQEAEDEGVAVEEDEWWYRVRLRKTALVGVLALTDAVACVMLGWDATSGAKRRLGLVEDALMVVFWVSRLRCYIYGGDAEARFMPNNLDDTRYTIRTKLCETSDSGSLAIHRSYYDSDICTLQITGHV